MLGRIICDMVSYLPDEEISSLAHLKREGDELMR